MILLYKHGDFPMKKLALLATVPLLIACAAETGSVTEAANDAVTAVAGSVETAGRHNGEDHGGMMPGSADLSTLPAGTYVDEDGHAYIQFSYDHQGFSKPILRWSAFEATVNYDPAAPEEATLRVVIPADSIDSMVPAFDDHLKSADFFDVENYPEIVFESTSVDIGPGGTGTVTGNLTIKDITREISFDGRINKIGQHFRSGKDMFGISGTGSLLRSDYGVGKYAPAVGDEVDLVMEIEFQKAD
jgi:polyisoprenoid-binding protein YceI